MSEKHWREATSSDGFKTPLKAPHWIDLALDLEGSVWTTASVKWDGCIHMTLHMNDPAPAGDVDTFHICDLDGFIADLQALATKAREHFGADWNRQVASPTPSPDAPQ
jgi:hypothetical protein